MSEEELKKQQEEQAKLEAEKQAKELADKEAEKLANETESEKIKRLRERFENDLEERKKKLEEVASKATTAEEGLKALKEQLKLKDKQLEVKEALFSSEIDPEFYDIVSDILMKAENTEEELKKLVETKPKMLKAKEEGNKSPYFTSSSSNGSSTMTKEKAMEIISSGDNKLYQANLAEITKVLT
jgi:hypothetical protein